MTRTDKFLLAAIVLWLMVTILAAQPLNKLDMFFLFYVIFFFWGIPVYLERLVYLTEREFERQNQEITQRYEQMIRRLKYEPL